MKLLVILEHSRRIAFPRCATQRKPRVEQQELEVGGSLSALEKSTSVGWASSVVLIIEYRHMDTESIHEFMYE